MPESKLFGRRVNISIRNKLKPNNYSGIRFEKVESGESVGQLVSALCLPTKHMRFANRFCLTLT
jgi:hypothetical protein